jgi:acyl dehydratase
MEAPHDVTTDPFVPGIGVPGIGVLGIGAPGTGVPGTGATRAIALGEVCARERGRVDEDAVYAYALAVNDRNDLYLQGAAVPPLFTATLILPALQEAFHRITGAGIIRDDRGGPHGEHDVHFHGTVRPGMPVVWESSFHSMKQTSSGVLTVVRIMVSDPDGAPLVEHFWSNYHIGASIDADLGAAPPDHTFPDDARAEPVGRRTVVIDRDQAFRYAGVSNDRAPHALDEEMARAEGYPTKILQGMCTFGLVAGAVVDGAAGGDPRRLLRLACRFAGPVFPRRELDVNLYRAGADGDGRPEVAFEGVQGDSVVVKHGRAGLVPD